MSALAKMPQAEFNQRIAADGAAWEIIADLLYEQENITEHASWTDLKASGYAALTTAQKTLLLTDSFVGECYNGGSVGQFFANCYDELDETIAALTIFGLNEHATRLSALADQVDAKRGLPDAQSFIAGARPTRQDAEAFASAIDAPVFDAYNAWFFDQDTEADRDRACQRYVRDQQDQLVVFTGD